MSQLHKDLRALVKLATDAGWKLTHTGGGFRVVPPGGGSGVTISSSPRNAWRTKHNLKRDLRRAGLDV